MYHVQCYNCTLKEIMFNNTPTVHIHHWWRCTVHWRGRSTDSGQRKCTNAGSSALCIGVVEEVHIRVRGGAPMLEVVHCAPELW